MEIILISIIVGYATIGLIINIIVLTYVVRMYYIWKLYLTDLLRDKTKGANHVN